MALTPLADVEALNERLVDDVTDDDRAESLLAAASALVRTETGSAWVDAGGNLIWDDPDATDALVLLGDTLASITVSVAARAYENPSGFISETKGPFTQRRSDDAGDGVYLTDGELDALRKAVALYRGAPSPGLWTLATTRGDIPDVAAVAGGIYDERTDTVYLQTVGGGDPLPYRDPYDPT